MSGQHLDQYGCTKLLFTHVTQDLSKVLFGALRVDIIITPCPNTHQNHLHCLQNYFHITLPQPRSLCIFCKPSTTDCERTQERDGVTPFSFL